MIKKMKKFYKEHRVFTILMAIVIVCVILITTVLIQCFYIGNGDDKYGDRLVDIDKHKIEESRITDFEKNLTNDKKVKSTDVAITGRIIYITFEFEENVSLDDAKNIARKSLENFTADEQAYYDINITLKQKEKDHMKVISGAKNKNGHGLVWNNNNKPVVEPPKKG